MRSAIYGDLRISEIDLNADYDILGQGITEGKIRIYSDCKNIEEKAMSFNNPPIVLCEANHTGNMPGEKSYLGVEADNATITVFKKCENSDALIVRGVENGGNAKKIKLTVKGNTYELEVSPFEIFTAKIHNGKINKVNLLEEEI